jgi:tetratricopeptide (TPR) repeat protein
VLQLNSASPDDLDAQAQRYVALFLVQQGAQLAQTGDIETALEAYTEAQSLDPDVGNTDAWNDLCWFGSLYGYAADVLFACEEAVASAPENGNIHDSRGLARALTGDTEGAIEDFRFAVGAWQVQEACSYQPCEQRLNWIAELESGRNPFDEATLKALREE